MDLNGGFPSHGATPKSSFFSCWIFHDKASNYWGARVFGTPHVILWGQQGAHFANTRTWIPPSLARDQHKSTGGPKTIYQSYSHIAQHID